MRARGTAGRSRSEHEPFFHRGETFARGIEPRACACFSQRGPVGGDHRDVEEPGVAPRSEQGLEVDLVKHADGTSNLTGLFKPSDRKPMKHVEIGKLTVSGSATITKADGRVGYGPADELRDLQTSIMACATMDDLRSVQITIQRIREAGGRS